MISSDPELDIKVKKSKLEFYTHSSQRCIDFSMISNFMLFCLFGYLATEKISENMHIVANDPSLAFYRLQEHIRKGKILIFEFIKYPVVYTCVSFRHFSNANDCGASDRS